MIQGPLTLLHGNSTILWSLELSLDHIQTMENEETWNVVFCVTRKKRSKHLASCWKGHRSLGYVAERRVSKRRILFPAHLSSVARHSPSLTCSTQKSDIHTSLLGSGNHTVISCAFKSNWSFESSGPGSPWITKQKQQCGVRARDTRTLSHSPELWPEVSKVLTQWLGFDLGKALFHMSLFLSAQAGLGQAGSHSGSHHTLVFH